MKRQLLKKISELKELSNTALNYRKQAQELKNLNDPNENKIKNLFQKSIDEEYKILKIVDESNEIDSTIEISTTVIDALKNIAYCYVQLDDRNQLYRIYQKLADLNDSEAAYLFARYCSEKGEYKKAANYFLKLKGKIRSFNFSASMGCYFQSLKPMQIEECKKYYSLAESTLKAMSPEERESKFTKAGKIDFYNNFGFFYLQLSPPDTKLATCYLSESAQYGFSPAQYNLSVCLDMLPDTESKKSALEWCEKSQIKDFF